MRDPGQRNFTLLVGGKPRCIVCFSRPLLVLKAIAPITPFSLLIILSCAQQKL